MPTTLITGSTTGIGRAIAFALGRDGHRIGVCARNGDAVRRTVAELKEHGIEAAGCAADVGREDDVTALVREVESVLGPVDVLVNNAGIMIAKPFGELSLEEWDATMATNVRSLYLMTRAVLPGMRKRKSGAVVNVASLAGKNGFVGGTAYSASKHAVMGFSRSLMLEVRQEGIRVLAICPGSVDTDLRKEGPRPRPNADRILQPEDVADMVAAALRLPPRALASELDLRPTAP